MQAYAAGEWRPPIVKTEATTGKGVAELVEAIERFRAHTARRGDSAAAHAPNGGCASCCRSASCSTSSASVLAPGELDAMLDRIAARELDPYSAVDAILRRAIPKV